MIDEFLIADAVVHAYNFTPENLAIPEARMFPPAMCGFHELLSPDPASRLTPDELLHNWQPEEYAAAVFAEAGIDLVAYHGTPIWDFFIDGQNATEKGIRWKQSEPNRVLVYGATNPFLGAQALADLERLAAAGVNGIKVYAARYSEGRTLAHPLNDAEFGFPFIEKALSLGIRVLAVHKAIPAGPVRAAPYSMGDLPEACARYPEMNFEVVHSGYAFVEETAFLLGSFKNVWLNLEGSSSLILRSPRRFAEFLGTFLLAGGEDRIVFASGAPVVHPLPTIRAIIDFEMPIELVEGMGYPKVTTAIKRKILGENYFRLHGIDIGDFRRRVAGDRWDKPRGHVSPTPMWSEFRSQDRSRVVT